MPPLLRFTAIAAACCAATFLWLRKPGQSRPAPHARAASPVGQAQPAPPPSSADAAAVPGLPQLAPDAATLKALAKTDPDLARALLRTLGATDPARGASSALALEEAGLNHAVREFLRGWISLDASAAWRWVAQRNGFKTSFIALIADTVSRGQPLAVAQALASAPPGNMKAMLTAELAKAWFASDREKAVEWIDSLRTAADQRTLDSALAGYLSGWAAQAPAEAATWAATQLPAGPLRREGIATAMQAWLAKGGVQQATAWLHAQPPAPDLATASSQLARALIETAPAEAIAWAKRSGDPVTADTVLAAGARHYASSEPTKAVRFAEEMSEGKMRTVALNRVITQWKAIDPAGLESYLRTEHRLLPAEHYGALQQLPGR